MRSTLIGLATVLSLLSACSSTPTHQDAAAPAPAAKPKPMAAPGVQANAVDSARLEQERLAALQRQQQADLNSKSVLFDFDSYIVKHDYADLLQAQAKFLQSQQSDRLTLQGNSDDRGSSEYNLALGQKRAEAVRKALVLLGAPGDRIETISFGEEKPKATCEEESCWSQNRRVDFAHAVTH